MIGPTQPRGRPVGGWRLLTPPQLIRTPPSIRSSHVQSRVSVAATGRVPRSRLTVGLRGQPGVLLCEHRLLDRLGVHATVRRYVLVSDQGVTAPVARVVLIRLDTVVCAPTWISMVR